MFTPFAALIILAGLRSFPNAPFEAARVDGASFWFTFRNLTLPMLTPFIIIVVVFRLMDSLKMFDIIFAMTEGGPGNTLMTYQLTAYRTSIQFQRLSAGPALRDFALHHHLHCEHVPDQGLGPRTTARGRLLGEDGTRPMNTEKSQSALLPSSPTASWCSILSLRSFRSSGWFWSR